MLKSGLVSATFRQLTPEQTVALADQAGLHGIEWSGDIHVPPKEETLALRALEASAKHGLAVCGYASYYRLGQSADPFSSFSEVLDTAKLLGTNTIRIWAGTRGSGELSFRERAKLCEEASLICGMAKGCGISISAEYHPNTLTDTLGSAVELLAAVPNLRTHWQVPPHSLVEENLKAIGALGDRITTIHVQNCEDRTYRPLREAHESWRSYIAKLAGLPGIHYLCLEFVKDGSAKQLMEDADTLNQWIKEAQA